MVAVGKEASYLGFINYGEVGNIDNAFKAAIKNPDAFVKAVVSCSHIECGTPQYYSALRAAIRHILNPWGRCQRVLFNIVITLLLFLYLYLLLPK